MKILRLKSHADPAVRNHPRPPRPTTPTVPARFASTANSEHQSETEFLRHCLHYGNHAGHQALSERIGNIQRDVRCVQRAVGLMAVLTALAAIGLGYVAILGGNIPPDTSRLVANGISGLGLAAMISLVAFVGLTVVFRTNLDEHRKEGRQLVTKLLASRLGKPATGPESERRSNGGNGETAPAAASENGSHKRTNSTA